MSLADTPPPPEAPAVLPRGVRRRTAAGALIAWLLICALLPALVLAGRGNVSPYFVEPFLLLGLLGGVLHALLVLLGKPRLVASPITAMLVGFWALLLASFSWLVPDGSGEGVNLEGIEWVIGAISLLGMGTALGVCGLWLRPRLLPFTR